MSLGSDRSTTSTSDCLGLAYNDGELHQCRLDSYNQTQFHHCIKFDYIDRSGMYISSLKSDRSTTSTSDCIRLAYNDGELHKCRLDSYNQTQFHHCFKFHYMDKSGTFVVSMESDRSTTSTSDCMGLAYNDGELHQCHLDSHNQTQFHQCVMFDYMDRSGIYILSMKSDRSTTSTSDCMGLAYNDVELHQCLLDSYNQS